MDHTGIEKLRANYVELVKNLNSEDVTDYLYQERVLTQEDIDLIMAEKTRAQKARKLLAIIPSKTKDGLEKFLQALKDEGYQEMASRIEHTKVELAEEETQIVEDTLLNQVKSHLQVQSGVVDAIRAELEEKERLTLDRVVDNQIRRELRKEKTEQERLVDEIYTLRSHTMDTAKDEKRKTILKINSIQLSNHQSIDDSAEQLKVKCVLVGDGSVGKTYLLARMRGNKFPGEFGYKPTVFDNNKMTVTVPVNEQQRDVEVDFWDVGGQEDYSKLRPLSYPDTDVVLILFSVISRVSLNNVLSYWVIEIKKHLRNIPILLVGTKVDSKAMQDVQEMERRTGQKCLLKKKEADAVAAKLSCVTREAFMTSALTGAGVTELLQGLVKTAVCSRYQTGPTAKLTKPKCALM